MSASGSPRRPCVVVMGVSAVGKTTVARLLSEQLGVALGDADDLHPEANIAKMSAGVPLDDTDRRPWLEAVGRWLRERNDVGGVVACSALKRSYRDVLRSACPSVVFLHLSASRALLADRIGQRTDHFMPASLLDSQLAVLEPLGPRERGLVIDAAPAPDRIVRTAVDLLTRPRDQASG
ncbi:gluconokinase [Streptacidiphilus sp. P02-A3a]|uniref:gluconokinase n=1 Tax=Streptacidiphilus sp. P02-A3a TaxID=2704468 RepID=UPI0015FBF076|nr:gluconokinase [Streptacidiphilus sp. P02-A3a]QMU69309.1 gluconokinase [Streptacidiphilus sp. P02-A3a]